MVGCEDVAPGHLGVADAVGVFIDERSLQLQAAGLVRSTREKEGRGRILKKRMFFFYAALSVLFSPFSFPAHSSLLTLSSHSFFSLSPFSSLFLHLQVCCDFQGALFFLYFLRAASFLRCFSFFAFFVDILFLHVQHKEMGAIPKA